MKRSKKVFLICLVIGIILSTVFYAIALNNAFRESRLHRGYFIYTHSETSYHFKMSREYGEYYCYPCDDEVSDFDYFLSRKPFKFSNTVVPLTPLAASLLLSWFITFAQTAASKKAEEKATRAEKFESILNDFD